MRTLEEMKKYIIIQLEDANKSTIVLVGDSGMGKTWMARKISEDDKYDTLWVYMTEKYDINLFYEDIAKQYLSLSPITEEWKHDEDETPLFLIKVEPEEKKADQKEESLSLEEKIYQKMREIGHALFERNRKDISENTHLLLVLDDLGNNNDDLYLKLRDKWRSMFSPKFHNRLKIIITTRKLKESNEQQTIEVIKFPQHLQPQESSDLLKQSVDKNVSEKSNYQQLRGAIADGKSEDHNEQQTIEVIDFPKHLQPQESLELLNLSVDKNVHEKSVFQQLREAIKDGKSEGIRKPATITVIAKALNYIAQHDAAELEMAILQAAYYEKTSEGEKLNPLIYCACDMIKCSVTKNCFWHTMHLFRSYGGVHFNVLITHWIMEDYFDHFDYVEEKISGGT